MTADLSSFDKRLGYQFAEPALLNVALTHKSRGPANYERLEFLGDSVLGFVVADFLYRHFEGTPEGKLSRMRAQVVRRETLALVARDLDLGSVVALGEGEQKSGGFNRESILADSLEAVIGAIYLDGGIEAATTFILGHFRSVLDGLDPGENYKDAKSRLQEVLQARGLSLPRYEVVETSGKSHEQVFLVECEVDDIGETVRASGGSRREAEQSAAAELLERLS